MNGVQLFDFRLVNRLNTTFSPNGQSIDMAIFRNPQRPATSVVLDANGLSSEETILELDIDDLRFDITATEPKSDLATAIDVLHPTVVAGDAPSNTFRVTVTNNGPIGASGVELAQTSTLPPHVTITDSSTSTGTFVEGIWSIGSLSSGDTASLTLAVRADSDAPSGTGILPVTFNVTGLNQRDPVDSNDSATAAASIISAADSTIGVTVAPSLSLQSGLFVGQVTVQNGNSEPIPAFRLYVKNLPGDMVVYNAAGNTGLGSPPKDLPYLLYNQPLAPDASVGLSVEFHRTSLDPDFTPIYEIELLAESETPPLAADSGIPVTRNQRLGNGDHLIEIASIPGARYAIEYSQDMTTWIRVNSIVAAPANRLQWIDNGPPKTHAHPSIAGSRFYRFVLIAAP